MNHSVRWLKLAAGLFLFVLVVGWTLGPSPLPAAHVAYVRYETGVPGGGEAPVVRFAGVGRDQPVVQKIQALVKEARVNRQTPPGLQVLPRRPRLDVVTLEGETLTFQPAWTCDPAGACRQQAEWVMQDQLAVHAPGLAAYLAEQAAADFPLLPPMYLAPRALTASQDLTVQGRGFTCSHTVLWLAKRRDPYTAATNPEVPPTPGAIRLATLQPRAGEWSWRGPLLIAASDYLVVAKGDGALDGRPCSAVLPVEVLPEPEQPKT